jgi:hypothetical protein
MNNVSAVYFEIQPWYTPQNGYQQRVSIPLEADANIRLLTSAGRFGRLEVQQNGRHQWFEHTWLCEPDRNRRQAANLTNNTSDVSVRNVTFRHHPATGTITERYPHGEWASCPSRDIPT